MNRKIGVILLALVAVICLSLGACNLSTGSGMTKEEALQSYIFEYDDQVVKDEFTLPTRIGDYRATWTSDNGNVLLEKRNETKDYLAKVTIPEEDQVAHLTVDLRGVSKTYTVRLQAITTQDIVDAFNFPQNKSIVYSDFELLTEATFRGKTATIEWSVEDEASKAYIGVEGNVCKVKASSLNPEVKINATFTYKGVTATTYYKFTVSEEMEHLQEVNYWYTNTGVSITMKGYVVAIATEYSSTYGNVSLYMVDENLDAGYYLYRVKCDDATAANLKPGVYVTCEGTTNTIYNGLYETNAGGTLTVDASKTIDLSTTVYAIDNDVVAGAPASNYNQSRLVSLTGWKVASKGKTAPEAGKTATLFTLEKNGAKVAVAVSKYLEGAYVTKATDEVWNALCAKYNEVNVGDIVSVTGLLGNYNGAQVMPLTANDIVIGGTETEATDGAVVKEALKQVNAKFKELPQLITSATTVELPQTVGTATVAYRLLGERTAFGYTEGTLVVTPGVKEVATIEATFTSNGYTAKNFYILQAEDLDDQGKADWEIENLSVLTEVKASGEYTLPGTKFFSNATIAWTSSVPYATVNGTKLTVSLPLEAGKMVLTATVTVGDKTSTRDYYVTVSAYDATKPVYADVTEGAPVGEFKALSVYQGNIAKNLYVTGKLSTKYLETTTDYTKAAKVVVTAVEGGYTITVAGKYLEVATDGSIKLQETASEGLVWTWNAETGTFHFANGETYYIGSYNTFETLSASKISYITGSNLSKIGVSQFVSKMVTDVQTQNAEDILASVIVGVPSSTNSDFALDSKATWEVVSGTGIVIDGYTAKVTQTDAPQTVVLKATLTYKDLTATKEVTVTVDGLVYEEKTLAEFIALEDSNDNFYTIKGFVTEITNTTYGNIYITDGTTTVYVYGLCAEKMAYSGKFTNVQDFETLGIKVGMYVELVSAKGSYKGTPQALGSGLKAKYAKKTLAEFIALEDSNETFYVIEGDVTEIKSTDYGNIYITDGTTTVYVYGLCAEKMAYSGKFTNVKDFNTLGVEVGKHVVILSAKSTYKGTPQAVGSGLISVTDASACDHTWDDGVVTTEATCSEEGVKTFTCTKCNETKTEAIAKADHDFSTEWTCDNAQHWHKCKNCDAAEESSKANHTDGDSDNLCDVCGESMGTTPIEEYESKTLAEFVALADDNTKFYKIEGVITKITNTKYGNLYLSDGTTTILVYGLCASKMEYTGGKFVNVQDFTTLNLEVGMHIVIVSAKTTYGTEIEAVGSGLLETKDATDKEMVIVAKANVSLPASVSANFELPTFEGVTITWTSDNTAIAISGTTATVTQSATEQTVTLTAVFTCNTATETVTYTVKVAAKIEGAQTIKFDFVNTVNDWTDWTNQYTSREVTSNGATIGFTYASKQTGTITDRPVVATGKKAENYDSYVTVDMGATNISSATFNLKQWNTKTFTTIEIQYMKNGTWTNATTTGTLSGDSAFTATFEATTQVRLHLYKKGSSNNQVGLTSIEVTTVA